MTRVRLDRRGYVTGATCACGALLLALPGGGRYVCERVACDRPALTAAQVFRVLNQRKPALQVVPGRQRQAVG